MSMEENDAATVLSQMSQLGCAPFDLTSSSVVENDPMLEADAIGATCTLQPSTLRNDFISQFDNGFDSKNDPYIGFDDAEHPYAVSSFSSETLTVRVSNAESSNVVISPTPQPTMSPSLTDTLVCLQCNKRFLSHQGLSTHMKMHKGKRSHFCQLCTRSFTTKSDLKRHQMVHQKSADKKYKCELCGSKFRDQATKTRHMKSHNVDKICTCEICGKTFNRCDSYKDHLRTHNEKKTFQCKICNSEFNYKSSFNRHVKTHQTSTAYSCDICGKSFKRQDYVAHHKNQVHFKTVSAEEHFQTKHIEKCDKKVKTARRKIEKKTTNRDKSMTASKRNKKVQHAKQQQQSDQINSQNAVPILMSMAENAANSLKTTRRSESEDTISSIGSSPMIVPLESPPQSDFMNLLDESSTEEDYESVCSDDLQICSDSDELVVSHVSCIVSNPCT